MSADRSRWKRRLTIWASCLIVGLTITVLLDTPVYHAISDPTKQIELYDAYHFFRALGYLPFWLFVAAAMFAHALRSRRKGYSPANRETLSALLVALAPIVAGLAAEVLKMAIGRERPLLHEGRHVFKPFLRGFVDSGGLGMPSSHAAVAFGGATAIAIVFPGTRAIAFIAASACAFTRLLTGAHFLSDAFLGAFVGYAAAKILTHVLKLNQTT